MPSLACAGVRVWYDATGSGPAVLLSHGFAASSATWARQVSTLVDAGHRAVVWDQRGHGRSGGPDDPGAYSEQAAVADMAAVLDAAGAERAALVGHSLGGYLSLAFHLAHPERVAALVLCNTGPGYRRDDARARWNALAERTARSHEGTPMALAARGVLVQRDARVMSSLATIAVPTLVVVGAEDTPFLAGSEHMASRIPGARLAVLDGAGHASNTDQPERFDHELIGFLSEVDW